MSDDTKDLRRQELAMMTPEEMRYLADSDAQIARDAAGGNTEAWAVNCLTSVLWSCCAEICERLDSIRSELQHANRND